MTIDQWTQFGRGVHVVCVCHGRCIGRSRWSRVECAFVQTDFTSRLRSAMHSLQIQLRYERTKRKFEGLYE
jgi:hypothetical protein